MEQLNKKKSICNLEKKMEKMGSIPFWSEDPNILFQPPYLLEFFPTESMTYNQKLNAVTRSVILLIVIALVFNRSTRLLIVAAISILAIFFMHYVHMQKQGEGFAGSLDRENVTGSPFADTESLSKAEALDPAVFDVPVKSSNPLGNVLVPDYEFNPHKKQAPAADNKYVKDDILKQAKQMVIDQNPGNKDVANKLFNDLANDVIFEQSMQPFYSTASTTIPNDQAAFADFCYGSMVSCKELGGGANFACGRNNPRYTTP